MSARRATGWLTICGAAALVGTSALAFACFLAPCDEPLIPVEDGSYSQRQATNPPENPPLRDITATLEDGELTIRYVQDADGRTYEVRLREVE